MNWDQRIAQAEKNGYFTNTDKLVSGNWTKCSVGEKLKIKSLDDARIQVESKLIRLGVEFCSAIVHNEIKRAKKLHNKIKSLK